MALSTDIDKIKATYGDYVVRPKDDFGIAGFYFDIANETDIVLQSEITDHYVEDNSAVQDHIANRPIELTLKYSMGELIYNPFESSYIESQDLENKLSALEVYLPELTSGVQQIKNTVRTAGQPYLNNVKQVIDLWNLTNKSTPAETRQQQAYLYFKSLWINKILVSVETPYEFFNNMAIKSIKTSQGADTRYISDFTISLKQYRTTSVNTIEFDASKYQSRTKQQRQPEENKGKAQGVKKSLLLEGIEEVFG